MSAPQMSCAGFAFGDWWVPPFELRDGEAITLGVPSDLASSPDEFVRKLTGEMGAAIRGSGKVIWAEPARPPQGLRRWIHGSSAGRWLRQAGVPADKVRAILQHLRIDGDDLRTLAGTPRLQLALAAARALGASVVVFSTRGLDPAGRLKSFESVKEHLPTCPAVYLSFPYEQAGVTKRDVFPDSTLIEITRRSPVAV